MVKTAVVFEGGVVDGVDGRWFQKRLDRALVKRFRKKMMAFERKRWAFPEDVDRSGGRFKGVYSKTTWGIEGRRRA